jgi:hypothetical protein
VSTTESIDLRKKEAWQGRRCYGVITPYEKPFEKECFSGKRLDAGIEHDRRDQN